MARHKRAAAPQQPSTAKRFAAHGFDVVDVDYGGARPVYTIDHDSPVWGGAALRLQARAIVRLRPPADCPPETLQAVQQAFKDVGAVVRVLPVPTRRMPLQAPQQAAAPQPVRAVVLAMVDECPSANRDALRAVVEHHLAENGL